MIKSQNLKIILKNFLFLILPVHFKTIWCSNNINKRRFFIILYVRKFIGNNANCIDSNAFENVTFLEKVLIPSRTSFNYDYNLVPKYYSPY